MNSTLITREQLKANRVLVPTSELKPWDKNPRAIEKADYTRLKNRCAGVQFKPLLVLQDGTVLGGNMRLLAYNDLGRENVWVSIVEFEPYSNSFVAFINGEVDRDIKGEARLFSSIEDGMLHYAITDNEEFGKYVESELLEITEGSRLPLEDYKISLGELQTLQDIRINLLPEKIKDDEVESIANEKKEHNVTCPNCDYKFDVNKL